MQTQSATTTVTALTTLALLALAGCGTESGRGADGADAGGAVRTDLPLTDVRWTIESLSVDGKKSAPPAAATVEIDSRGRLSGSTGCNSLGAKAQIDGDTITVSDTVTTLKGCPEELAAFETVLNGALSGKLKAKVEDKKLTLTSANGDSIALTAAKPVPFTGTKWTVDGTIADGTVTSLPSVNEAKGESAGPGGEPTLTFAKDGTVTGNLGCNSFSAPAEIAGSKVTLGPVRSTKKICPEPAMTVERKLMKVLKGQMTYEVRHQELTLKDTAGKGLTAVADEPAS